MQIAFYVPTVADLFDGETDVATIRRETGFSPVASRRKLAAMIADYLRSTYPFAAIHLAVQDAVAGTNRDHHEVLGMVEFARQSTLDRHEWLVTSAAGRATL